MPQWTVPTGSENLTAGMVLPGMNWLYGWDIFDWLSTAGSTQLNKAVDDDDEIYYEFAQSWTFGYTLTEHWGAYTEWFVLVPSGIGLGPHAALFRRRVHLPCNQRPAIRRSPRYRPERRLGRLLRRRGHGHSPLAHSEWGGRAGFPSFPFPCGKGRG